MDNVMGAAISGGGPKGAFAAGFMFHLFDRVPEVSFEILAGTSTGALVAPMVAQQLVRGPLDKNDLQHELAIVAALYQTSTFDTFFERGPGMTDAAFQRLVGTKLALAVDAAVTGSMVHAENLRRLVDRYLPDDPDFWAQPGAPTLVQACLGLKRNDVYYFRTDRPGHRSLMKEATRADAALRADGTPRFTGKDWYCDGGVGDYVPIRGVIAAGATKVLAIVHRHMTWCRERSTLADEDCFPRDQDGEPPLAEKPDAVTTLSATIDSFAYQVGIDDLRVAVLADRLSALRGLWDRLVERVENADIEPQTRTALLRNLDPEEVLTSYFDDDDLLQLLGLEDYIEQRVEVWPVFIPDSEALPKNDLDFSRNRTLFVAGQRECARLLQNGLQTWLQS
jgi:predicted acylesterase/phospholipase RssA